MTIRLDADRDWLLNTRIIKSSNCDARTEGMNISLLVLHNISLPPGQFGGLFIDQLFTNTLDRAAHPYFQQIADLRVSAHLLIDRSGELTQYVSFSQRAWHAGDSSFQGQHGCNDFSIGIELEGADDKPYKKRQYITLSRVTDCLVEAWPAICRDRIVGHADIAPGRKTDPGPTFNWEYYFSLCNRL